MKPDMSLFPELRDEGQFRQWWNDFVAACGGTNLGDVCNFSYTPHALELPNFTRKSNWVFTVLWHKVQSTIGRDILESLLDTQNG